MVATPGHTLRESYEQKFSRWFENRYWRVCTEVSGERSRDGKVIRYCRGFFRVEPPWVFQTPLGNRGRAGYMVQEIGLAGNDLPGAGPVAFGRKTLERAREHFGPGAVAGLPERDPRLRPDGTWVP